MDKEQTSDPTQEQKDLGQKMNVDLGKSDEAPEKGKAEPSADADKTPEQGEKEADWKKMYGDSTREVQEKYLPMEKEYGFMMGMVDKHPDLNEKWNEILDREEKARQSTPEKEGEITPVEKRIENLEQDKKNEGIRQTQEALSAFRSDHPDLTDGQYDSISKLASVHVRKYGDRSFKDAVRQALEDEFFLQNRDQAKAEGRKEAMVEEKKRSSASIPQAASAQTTTSNETLTEEQKTVARNLGVDLEKVAKNVK